MSYATVEKISVGEIPVIDISSLFGADPQYLSVGKALQKAATEIGFFYVSGHSIHQELLEQAFSVSKNFFAAPEEAKATVLTQGYHRGLLAMGVSKMEGQQKVDLKESYIWGEDYVQDNADFLAGNELLPPNRWPNFMPEIRQILPEYLHQAHHTGKQLLRAIAASLDIDLDYFVGKFRKPITRSTLIHYPPQPPTMGEEQFGVSPHTDYGTITLLAQDDTGGLRVQGINGNWLTAHPIEGTIVVNVGDLLARWSNNRFRSTPHCVVNASGKERYSIATAMDPDWDTLVSPVVKPGEQPLYEDVLCGDYIRGRFDRSFSYRQQ